jgi:hypothetical protein
MLMVDDVRTFGRHVHNTVHNLDNIIHDVHNIIQLMRITPFAHEAHNIIHDVPGLGFRVSGLAQVRVSGVGRRVSGVGFRVSDFGCRVSGVGYGCRLWVLTGVTPKHGPGLAWPGPGPASAAAGFPCTLPAALAAPLNLHPAPHLCWWLSSVVLVEA